MDDKYFQEGAQTRMTFWIMGHMAKGMGLALAFCLGLGLLYAVIWGVGQLLPEQSKQMPSPYSQTTDPLPFVV